MRKNILDTIVAHKKKEITKRKEAYPLASLLKDLGKKSFNDKSFLESISNPKAGDIAVIAEIKLKSPSAGVLGNKNQLVNRAITYQSSYADSISLVTDNRYFGGNVEMVSTLKKNLEIPILQKDFVIDTYQIYEAKKHKADALLLIAKICKKVELQNYINLCNELHITPVIEVYDVEDLQKISGTHVIGVNARNLEDFTVHVEKACELIKKISNQNIVIGFSGVASRKEVELYKQAGVKAVLVGTNLMKSDNVSNVLKSLKGL